jgi:hypothetical protein
MVRTQIVARGVVWLAVLPVAGEKVGQHEVCMPPGELLVEVEKKTEGFGFCGPLGAPIDPLAAVIGDDEI